MWGIRSSMVVGLMSLALNGAVLGACGAGQSAGAGQKTAEPSDNRSAPAKATPTPQRVGDEKVSSEDIKDVAEGGYSGVEETFVAVVRDAETYEALRQLVGELPPPRAELFKTHAVVAAFLGMRNSGGYGVKITRAQGGALSISETTPPKGAMTTMALTSPFRIVSVPLSDEAGIRLELDAAWKKVLRAYNVREGDFTVSGGIAGRTDKFNLEGGLRVVRVSKLVTVFFDLKSGAGAQARVLQATASGPADDAGNFKLPRINDTSIVNWSSSGLRATGQMPGDGQELSLSFDSLPSNIADGFNGRGRITAVATAVIDYQNPRGGNNVP